MENKLILAGDVVNVNKDSMTLTTMDVGSDGREFVETHEIIMTKKELKEVKAGNRVRVIGHLGRDDHNRTVIIGDTVSLHDDLQDINVAKLVGKAHRTFEFYPRIEGSGAFGSLLVTVNQTIYRGTAFGHTAHMLSRQCLIGSTVRLQGRIRTREYTDRNGDTQRMTEIVAHPDFTKVLEVATIIDPFDELDKVEKKVNSAGI